jgi:hypothetical protein
MSNETEVFEDIVGISLSQLFYSYWDLILVSGVGVFFLFMSLFAFYAVNKNHKMFPSIISIINLYFSSLLAILGPIIRIFRELSVWNFDGPWMCGVFGVFVRKFTKVLKVLMNSFEKWDYIF